MLATARLWVVTHIISHCKLVWSRLTCNRLVSAFFAFTVFHCALQVIFQFSAHTINFRAGDFLEQVVAAAGLSTQNFTLYDTAQGSLRSCWGIPGDGDETCRVVWTAEGKLAPQVPANDKVSTTYGGLPSVLSLTLSPSSTAVTTSTTLKTSSTLTSASTTTPTPAAIVDNGSTTEDDDSDDDSDDESESTKVTTRSPRTVVTFVTVQASPTSSTGSTSPSVRSTRLSTRSQGRKPLHKRNVFITQITARSDTDPLNMTVTGLRIGGLDKGVLMGGNDHSYQEDDARAVEISLECAQVTRWPLQALRNTKREDLVFVGFQLWVFGICIVALLNESIPHIIAAFLTHVLSTIWSGFQLAHTAAFRRNFNALTVDGACRGINLLPGYWSARAGAEIPVLVLNCVSLLISAFLSWKLVKSFGWATFKRVGADLRINRVYKLVLCMSIILQLSLFFIVTSMALWIDQLYNGFVGVFARHGNIYRITDLVTFLLLLPWLALGWFAVRRENNKMMYAFIGLSVMFVVDWAVMFASHSWRLTFTNWAFFAIMSVVAALFTIMVLILGIICQRNFGYGLSNYLNGAKTITDESGDGRSDDVEKQSFSETVAFPNRTLPTYSDGIVPNPLPSVQLATDRGQVKRASSNSSRSSGRSFPSVVRYKLADPSVATTREKTLSRSISKSSSNSASSNNSFPYDTINGRAQPSGMSAQKRWVIE